MPTAAHEEERVRDALVLAHAFDGQVLSRAGKLIADPLHEPIPIDEFRAHRLTRTLYSPSSETVPVHGERRVVPSPLIGSAGAP